LARSKLLGTVFPSLSFDIKPDHPQDNQKGLEDANNKQYDEETIVQTIASYLPSGFPVDAHGMEKLEKELLDRRWKERLEEEAEIQKRRTWWN
jgi:hypothetical protein